MPKVREYLETQAENTVARVLVPPALLNVIERLADKLKIPPIAGMRMLMEQIEASLIDGQAGFLGPLFENALRDVRRENFGVVAQRDPIDLSKLHRSSKTKSGFVGVYASGAGFKAMGKLTNGTEGYIGTFESAEEAAAMRRRHYEKHGFPYGELALLIEKWRKDHPTMTAHMSELDIVKDIWNYQADTNAPYTFNDQIEAYLKRHGVHDDEVVQESKKSKLTPEQQAKIDAALAMIPD